MCWFGLVCQERHTGVYYRIKFQLIMIMIMLIVLMIIIINDDENYQKPDKYHDFWSQIYPFKALLLGKKDTILFGLQVVTLCLGV